jgi:hypothetical protein
VVNGTRRRRRLSLASVAVAVPLLAACSSSGSGGGAAAAKAPAPFCSKLLAVLSDGPDPGADPVGYALSQIEPLGGIHDGGSRQATVTSLIAADKDLVSSEGRDPAAAATIKGDYKTLNDACPGVAP